MRMLSAGVRGGCVLMGVQWLVGCSALPEDGAPDLDSDGEEVGETKAALTGRDCNDEEMNNILAPPTPNAQVAQVACNFTYPRKPQSFMKPGEIYPGEIRKEIEFSGPGAVGITFSCKGHRINHQSSEGRAIAVRTDSSGNVPHDITIKDCEVNGNIRLVQGDQTICSGCADPAADAIARRQATAPHHIYMRNLKITAASGGNGVHFSGGVSFSSLTNSSVRGSIGRNTAIYLSPESANNAIVGNFIGVNTENREQIAIDGSANNYIADNDLSALNHGGIYIFRNCGEDGTVRIQKPWHNSIVNNRFYYEKFDDSDDYPALWVASRTIAYEEDGQVYYANRSDYCGRDNRYPFGSGIDDSDNAKYTVAAHNQIRKGQHDLSVAELFHDPTYADSKSLPFDRFGNRSVTDLSTVPTLAIGAAGEPSVLGSLYLVQGTRLWRTDEQRGISVALKASNWTGSTSMATLGGKLYIIQYDGLYEVDPATGADRHLPGATWAGPTSMAALGGRLFVVQDGALWVVDDFSTGRALALSRAGTWAGATSMAALSGYLYIVQDNTLWRVNPSNGDYTPLGGADWAGPTLMAAQASTKGLFIIQDGSLWRIDDLSTGSFTLLGAFGTWTGSTSMTYLSGKLYVIQDNMLWSVDPSTGGYTPIERPHFDYSGPTVMTAIALSSSAKP